MVQYSWVHVVTSVIIKQHSMDTSAAVLGHIFQATSKNFRSNTSVKETNQNPTHTNYIYNQDFCFCHCSELK